VRQTMDSNTFWAVLLRDENIDWEETTKIFIRTYKTIAPGSVACETVFSIFNNIKTKARMRTSDSHVESDVFATQWLLQCKAKPMVAPKKSSGVPEKPFEILDDTELDDHGSSLFQFDVEPLRYNDVYTVKNKTQEFRENTDRTETHPISNSQQFNVSL